MNHAIDGNPCDPLLAHLTLRVLSGLTTKLSGTRWRLRNIVVLPNGPKMMFDGLHRDGKHVATISLEWTGTAPTNARERFRWRYVHETCTLGIETTELYEQFKRIVTPFTEAIE